MYRIFPLLLISYTYSLILALFISPKYMANTIIHPPNKYSLGPYCVLVECKNKAEEK